MMTLQAVSKNKELLNHIADLLLKEKLVANAIISSIDNFKTLDTNGGIIDAPSFSLKCISKSLLFSTINNLLRETYGEKTPLLYSEPIILIDPEQTETIIDSLKLV